jgi:tyrosyl-tRNA synthetase
MTETAILADLAARGLVHDSTDRAELGTLLSGGPVGVYCGFDPTADSLHAGNLIGLLALRRFQLAGHRPLALAGGATGMVGDPSGRSDERNLLDEATLAHNLASIKEQIGRFLDFEAGPCAAELVDNRTWTEPVSYLSFLRDVGKHFTINQMVAKESVRARMESDNGISYTEFSYMLLQAFDFAWLAEHKGCRVQIGGSDQWGNITAGIDLVRKRGLPAAHGLTWPLMTRADGAKFGKTAAGAVWLSAARTSPFAFFQYWVQVDDRDVEKLLLQLTFVPVEEIRSLVEQHAAAPEQRRAQRRLAEEVTTIVHGAAACAAAAEATDVVFGRAGNAGGEVPSAAALGSLVGELPTTTVTRASLEPGRALIDLLVEAGAASSKSDARRTLEQQGYVLNGTRPSGVNATVALDALVHERFLLIRRGKKQVYLVVAG